MRHTLRLSLSRVEGAITRTLGLVERRGFSVTSISALGGPDAGDLDMVLEVETNGRRSDVLARQIEKLFDVRSVTLITNEDRPVGLKASVAC